jgi:hypothetical protein
VLSMRHCCACDYKTCTTPRLKGTGTWGTFRSNDLWKQEPGSSGSIVSDYRPGDRGSIRGRGKGFFL